MDWKPKVLVLDGLVASGKSTVLEILGKTPNSIVVPEDENEFIGLLTQTEALSDQEFTAHHFLVQITVMKSIVKALQEANTKITKNTELVILERNVSSAEEVFAKLAVSDKRFLEKSKETLQYITYLIKKEVPKRMWPDMLVVIAPKVEIVKERLHKRKKTGDDIYTIESLSNMKDLYDKYFAKFDKQKVMITGELSPEDVANTILKKIELK